MSPRRLPLLIALFLAAGWAAREVAHAREHADAVASQTVTLDQVKMADARYEGVLVGHAGIYVSGDTPGSKSFVTGRFVIEPGKSPHPPHTHPEEEVMIIEAGTGEIFVDGKITKVGPGSAMYTVPESSHNIVNTGKSPLTFYFIKWASKK